MTRKDYVKTSDILNEFKEYINDEVTFADLVDEFASMFEADNPGFDATRFCDACNK